MTKDNPPRGVTPYNFERGCEVSDARCYGSECGATNPAFCSSTWKLSSNARP